jgi:HAD superfamily hydrolase (TIGR01484 family)
MVDDALDASDWLLVTDIDGTLIGERESTLALRAAVIAERERLEQLGARLYWVINTGRTRDSTHEVLLENGFELDDFDALVTCVGAELFLGSQPEACTNYHAALSGSGFDALSVRAALDDLRFLKLQADAEQRSHKVSYHLPDEPGLRERVELALAALPFETHCVYAHDNYLDIAPYNGAKGGAVQHLIQQWGLPTARVVAAGDSGNDLSMLNRDWRGIVVGNGHGQLAALRALPQVYFARNRYAAGVHEGLLELGFLRHTR